MAQCESFADDLVLFLAGEGDGDRRLRLQEHLRVCEACRSELDEMRAADEALVAEAAVARREAPMPDALRRTVVKNLRRRSLVRRPAFLVPAGIAAGLLLGLWLLWPEPPAETVPVVRVEPEASAEPASVHVLSADSLRAISQDIDFLTSERVRRAIPSSTLTFVDARMDEDVSAGSLPARRVVTKSARFDRNLHTIARRIQEMDRDTWYVPAQGAQRRPSSCVPEVSREPDFT